MAGRGGRGRHAAACVSAEEKLWQAEGLPSAATRRRQRDGGTCGECGSHVLSIASVEMRTDFGSSDTKSSIASWEGDAVPAAAALTTTT